MYYYLYFDVSDKLEYQVKLCDISFMLFVFLKKKYIIFLLDYGLNDWKIIVLFIVIQMKVLNVYK